MTYQNGRVETDASTGGRVPVWTYDDVEQRMVEAMQHWWRSHDPEAKFSLGGRISSAWRQYFPTRLDLAIWGMLADAPEADAPKALPLSRADMQRMNEASDWLAHVPEADRRLVVLALTKLAAGHKRVPWSKLLRPLGHQHGADRLRMRYGRALTKVCNELNLAEKRQGGLSTQQMTPPSK